jgi:AcrR family transcriptional regulator
MEQKRERNSRKSREDILCAAEEEFSSKGLYGARVDEIANLANINKRMIYEYFGSKEELYKAVLVEVYSRLSRREMGLLATDMPCDDKIRCIIRLYFEFMANNPSYVNMILWENLNQGRYIQEMDFSKIKDPSLDLIRRTIEQGKSGGVFKPSLDTEQTILSLLMVTFSYFSNRFTLSKLLGKKLDDEESLRRRIETVTDMFLDYMCLK